MSAGVFRLTTESKAISGTEFDWPATTMEAPRNSSKNRFIAASLFGFVRGRLRFQNDFLHAERGDLRHEQLVRIPAIDLVYRAEFLQLLSGFSETAEDRSIQLHLVNLTGDVAELRQTVVRNRIRN